DPRFTLRVIRTLPSLRKRLSPEVLSGAIRAAYPSGAVPETLQAFFASSESGMDVDGDQPSAKSTSVLPEVEVYLQLLVQIYLIDQKKFQDAAELSSKLAKHVHSLNRRTLDPLAAQVYYYFSQAHEQLSTTAFIGIRAQLLAARRTATLRKE